ncbi:hypothetical protein PILCRDRAFT_813446 [Piloderma croceum F 1598]|uniref:Uncharacterized protein n=1 Tax=Piloderma croceum (strain F 1598) TaxID=765440 RepID=A0A0C3GCS8_PILCF|nr:hypothetical protein PILCRDRAFT_813446 [Piloderma croceum F 1598]
MALASHAARVTQRASLWRAIPARVNTQHGQRIMRRNMSSSSGGHSGPKSSNDMPWIVASAVVFVPLALYLLRPVKKDDHGHGHGNAHHEEDHEKDEHDSSDGEGMTDDEGTEASAEEIGASMRESINSDSPKDAKFAEESDGDEKQEGQNGTFQSEDEPPQPTNMADARKEALKQAKK